MSEGIIRPVLDGELYVSSSGEVFSLDANGEMHAKKQCGRTRNGVYKGVTTNINGKKKSYSVHRLVAEAFIPNPNNYPQINHKDGNGHNNSVDNLEWCTQSHNTQHAWDNGLINPHTSNRSCASCGTPIADWSKSGLCSNHLHHKWNNEHKGYRNKVTPCTKVTNMPREPEIYREIRREVSEVFGEKQLLTITDMCNYTGIRDQRTLKKRLSVDNAGLTQAAFAMRLADL